MNISVTNFLIIINVFMFMQCDIISIFFNKYNVFSPKLIVDNQEVMRLIIPNICHVDSLHLFLNMISLHRMGHNMETLFKKKYIYIICLLGVLSSLIHVLYSLLGVYLYDDNSIYNSYSMGFSSIIFGLRYIYLTRLNTTVSIFGFDMHSSYVTFVSSPNPFV